MPESFAQTTIRSHLYGVVADHLMQGHITCSHTQQVGCELVSLLSAYREEDRQLFPEVYLLAPEEGDLLPLLAPGAPQLEIGQVKIEGEAESLARKTARIALKSCASLAIEGWRVYIRRDGKAFRYGLFSPVVESYSVGAEATLIDSGLPCVVLRNSAENTVEIVKSNGGRLEISLTSASPSNRPTSEQVVEFVRCACSDVAVDGTVQAVGYLTRVLTELLRASHGTLLAVAPHGQPLPPDKFSDGVIFAQPIPLVERMLAAVREQSPGANSLLRSHESLLRGMILSDGITVLGTDGSIKAFRVFVHGHPGVAQPTGGARTRAFEVLKSHLNSPLKAVLVRSQDGRTEVVKS